MNKVSGRSVDLFKTKDGDLIDGEYFTHLMYYMNWIDRFQFVQVDYDFVLVRVVVISNSIDKDLQYIEDKVKLVMGNRCKVKFEFVNKLPDPVSGKYRYTLSNI